jgi:protein-tyrosine phosphatase
MFDSILLVCTANVCRSPLAEALFKLHLPDRRIASAGTRVAELNYNDRAADAAIIEIAHQHNLDLTRHQAQPFTVELSEQFDLILTMTPSHQNFIMNSAPSLGAKTLLVGQWIGLSAIDDPFGKSQVEFERCFHDLQRATLSWKEKLVTNL